MENSGLHLCDQSAFFRLHPGEGLLLLLRFRVVVNGLEKKKGGRGGGEGGIK